MNDVIVHSGPLYAATETLIARILSRFGASYVDFPAEVSRDQMDAILARARDMAAKQGGKVAMVYLESPANPTRSEEHTSELQSLMRITYDVFCLKKKNNIYTNFNTPITTILEYT